MCFFSKKKKKKTIIVAIFTRSCVKYSLRPHLPLTHTHTYTHMHACTHRFPSLEVDIEKELEVLSSYAARLKPMVCDTVLYVNTAVRDKKKVVVEGANAAMLDIDFGEY